LTNPKHKGEGRRAAGAVAISGSAAGW
jgi:hypothetical protein